MLIRLRKGGPLTYHRHPPNASTNSRKLCELKNDFPSSAVFHEQAERLTTQPVARAFPRHPHGMQLPTYGTHRRPQERNVHVDNEQPPLQTRVSAANSRSAH